MAASALMTETMALKDEISLVIERKSHRVIVGPGLWVNSMGYSCSKIYSKILGPLKNLCLPQMHLFPFEEFLLQVLATKTKHRKFVMFIIKERP